MHSLIFRPFDHKFYKIQTMKIAIVGYGKMGMTIEALAKGRGHDIAAVIDHDTKLSISDLSTEDVDVAIEFTNPDVAFHNLCSLAEKKIPVISGTTGWLDRYQEVVNLTNAHGSALLYASNFSIGVNMFFAVNQYVASLMAAQKDYQPTMEEIHHIHKLDAPSGTAISLADDIIDALPHKTKWINQSADDDDSLAIISKRIDEVPGTHSIRYESQVDQITITHEAFSRQGFALGAIIAAEWINGKSGIYTMKDVLKINH